MHAHLKKYKRAIKRKKGVPEHVFVQIKNGGGIPFVSVYETTTTLCDASMCL